MAPKYFKGRLAMKRQVWVTALTVIFISVCCFLLMTPVVSAPGDLDTTFNGTGVAITEFGHGDDTANAATQQADGKLVIAGSTSGQVAVCRYNLDGSLDTSFGGTGKVRIDVSFGSAANGVKIQADGKIVLAGVTQDFQNNQSFLVIRLNPDGTQDKSFGQGGQVTTLFGRGEALALQVDQKIVVIGTNSLGIGVVRYNTDGTLDSSFGTGGKAIVGAALDVGSAVMIQPDGKIVIADDRNNPPAFVVIRLNTNGSPDNTFGSGGTAVTSFGLPAFAEAVALQPATLSVPEKIVVAGVVNSVGNDIFALARYNLDGSLDNTFDTDGKLTTAIGPVNFLAGLVITGGVLPKIVLAGTSGPKFGNLAFTLVRYNLDGSLDPTFGGTGSVVTPISNNGSDFAHALTIQSGKLVIAGSCFTSNYDFAVARYNSNG